MGFIVFLKTEVSRRLWRRRSKGHAKNCKSKGHGVSPHFLPDGRHFLFTASSHRPEIRGIYVGSLDSAETRRLLSDESHVAYAPPGYLLFIRDWTLMAQPFDAKRLQITGEPFPVADQVTNVRARHKREFLCFRNRHAGLFQGRPISDNSPGSIERVRSWVRLGCPDAYNFPSLSPDEKTIAVTKANPQIGASDIWLIDAGRGHPSRFTFAPEPDVMPIWSPDGSRIVFASSRNGTWDLYQKATSGTAQEEVLLKSNEGKFPTDWSWDGRFIAYNRLSPEGGTDLWVLPLFGDRKPIPFVQSEFDECMAISLPTDVGWHTCRTNLVDQRSTFGPFPVSAGILAVSTGGGSHPRWRRDGKELFYLSPHGKLMVVEVNGGERFRAGVPKALFQMRLPMDFDLRALDYAVTADGQRFLFAVPPAGEAASPNVTVVLNWPPC